MSNTMNNEKLPHTFGMSIYKRYNNDQLKVVTLNTSLCEQPTHTLNQGKTSIKHSVYDRILEELSSAEYLQHMMQDEANYMKLRVYKPEVRYYEEIGNVYRFIFEDGYYNLQQRTQTCHLAMAYFTQTIMRCPNLKKNEIGVISAAALMVASKFDELDYNLPPASYICKIMNNSKSVGHYDVAFNESDLILCEKNI